MIFKPSINYDRSVSVVKTSNGAGIFTSFTVAGILVRDGIVLGSIIRSQQLIYIQNRDDVMNSNKCYSGIHGVITTTNSRTKKFNYNKKNIDI